MNRTILIAFLVLFFFSCKTVEKMDYYDETVQFYKDFLSEEDSFCARRINNDYWLKVIEENRLNSMRKYLDSLDSRTFDDYTSYELKYKLLTLQSVSVPQRFTVDYERVTADLQLTNNKRFSQFVDCDLVSEGHISLPIFNNEMKMAVIETEGGTFIYKKDKNGRWIFKDRGLLRIF